jgi:hypothetical protein
VYPAVIPPSAAALFEANLGLIDRVIGGVCRRPGLFGADAEDFASAVKLALIKNDYAIAILRPFEGRSALSTFLTIKSDEQQPRDRAVVVPLPAAAPRALTSQTQAPDGLHEAAKGQEREAAGEDGQHHIRQCGDIGHGDMTEGGGPAVRDQH